MSFLQPYMLAALPLISLPILIHLINQRRYQTKRWAAMMFLLTANRMNRGFARLRQWLILAMRTLAIAALIIAVARPLSSGWLGFSGGGRADTTIVLMDRSPSMQQMGLGSATKFESGRRQLAQALETIGSQHWVSIDSVTNQAQSHESLAALLSAPAMQPSDATANLPMMLQAALEYIQNNKPGSAEVWICSDIRESDWNATNSNWSMLRDGFQQLPSSIRFHLLAYPTLPKSNRSIRVTEVRRESTVKNGAEENHLLLSMSISQHGDNVTSEEADQLPVQLEIDGQRSELSFPVTGQQTDIRSHRVPIAQGQRRGWGKVTLPADALLTDNHFYFAFDDPLVRRVVIVSEDREATRALEIAAEISADGSSNSTVDVIAPDQLDSLVLDEASLIIWQTSLPDQSLAPSIADYVNKGGQVIFFPPANLQAQSSSSKGRTFFGATWDSWVESPERVKVEYWRGDQDLFAATNSGVGLPVGQLEFSGYAKLSMNSEHSTLASLAGGDPLLVRIPTDRGGVYFITASSAPDTSSLAENGVVLFVALQRAIERGQAAQGNTSQRTAGASTDHASTWRLVSGRRDTLSTEYASNAGAYTQEDRYFVVNRSELEDRPAVVEDAAINQLFDGLQFSRVDDSAGNATSLLREVWRLFLISLIVALLAEAILCLPRDPSTTKIPTAA